MRNVFFTLSIVLLLSVVGTNSDLSSAEWSDCTEDNMISACDTTTSSDSTDTVSYMGCELTIVYKILECIDSAYTVHFTYLEIESITFSPVGCDSLYEWLYDTPDSTLSEENFLQMVDSSYTLLFELNFLSIEDQYECPNAMAYTYYWPGTCMMACQYLLDNGDLLFMQHSCNEENEYGCCGKSITYCKQGDTLVVDESIMWVGTACPAQTAPLFEKCTYAVGDTIGLHEVLEVKVSLCESSCFDE